ncbi:MAG: GGDEF domain-containing phosphodiesterase [Eubacteriales bacterium]|nr:GGDEF domain-containing phosphodiesterase [Eubacteriales bacterium]
MSEELFILQHNFDGICRLEDVTKEDLFNLAYRDGITGYYNWAYMWRFLYSKSRIKEEFCFVHFDIKDFKMVNELYGHDLANQVLCMVCDALKNAEDWVFHSCRCDNDNFAMMVKPESEEKLRTRLEQFFDTITVSNIDPQLRIYYRCGVVLVDDAKKWDDRVADLAKFAQRMGKRYNCTEINFYTQGMYEKMLHDKQLVVYLDRAISNDEFMVYLQPKYEVNSERIIGAEALVRWNYMHEKLLPPIAFIPAFENYDVIGKLDQVVLRKVCNQIKIWQEKGLPVYPISVNLSRKRMENKQLREQICSVVDEVGIDHRLIEFELTESASSDDVEFLRSLITELRALDFYVSMDDFGTGYSSLSLLNNMSPDTIKMDKSFVDSIIDKPEDSKECMLVRDIISMTKHLGFQSLAEGVEYKEQVDLLRKWGCNVFQGYYFSKPVPIPEYEQLIRAQENML